MALDQRFRPERSISASLNVRRGPGKSHWVQSTWTVPASADEAVDAAGEVAGDGSDGPGTGHDCGEYAPSGGISEGGPGVHDRGGGAWHKP